MSKGWKSAIMPSTKLPTHKASTWSWGSGTTFFKSTSAALTCTEVILFLPATQSVSARMSILAWIFSRTR